MAYVSQELKKQLAPAIKAILKKYKVKGSIAVRHHSTLVVNIKEGEIDFANSNETRSDHYQVNPYWIADHWTGQAQAFLLELKEAMSIGNWDKSDIQTDYFNVGWYVDINIGHWDKPYTFTGEKSRVRVMVLVA